jgi:hypothetical protein
MPRKNIQPRPATPVPEQSDEKKWAEPYRPIVTNADAGIELAENKLANLIVFSFAKDPGSDIKAKLKHYGYFYDTRQKTWTVNATPPTREIARRLVEEFTGGKDKSGAAAER